MACRLYGAKPLSEPMLNCCPLHPCVSGILIVIHTFSFKKIYLKMSSGEWRPFFLGLNLAISRFFAYTRPSHIDSLADAVQSKRLYKKSNLPSIHTYHQWVCRTQNINYALEVWFWNIQHLSRCIYMSKWWNCERSKSVNDLFCLPNLQWSVHDWTPWT